MSRYADIYRRSLNDPEGFWAEAAEAIDWDEPWTRVLDAGDPPFYRWFQGGRLNICHNCIDRHVLAGRGDQVALIHDSPVTRRSADPNAETIRKLTYNQLLDQVSRFAGVLSSNGISRGDRVVVYMPMIPEAAIAMLACARIGAVHSVVFGGFAGHELAKRLNDAQPKALITASCGIEPARVIDYKPLFDQAIAEAQHPPSVVIVKQRERQACALEPGRDLDWDTAIADAEPAGCVSMAATDPLYILYTSGTTGQPKGVVRDTGGYAVALNWTMPNVYGMAQGDVWWTASDVGWVVGHSYIVYGPLLYGLTTVMYEGKPVGTPDAGAFWRVIAQHGVRALFTAPTAFRAIRQQDPRAEHLARHDLRNFKALFLAGERCDPDTLAWATETLKVPVIDHWWQTETGWPIAANPTGIEALPVKPGSPTVAMPGWDLSVLDAEGAPVPAGEIGSLVCSLPLPPGALTTLWRADDRFRSSYLTAFPGYYQTGDAGFIDEDGYVFVMARTDDVINVAGHRLSTGALEEVLAEHPDVSECAVIGVGDPIKGQVPVGLVVLAAGVDRTAAEIQSECLDRVRRQIGAVASLKRVIVVTRLPKTRSGKILRATMRKLAEGEDPVIPATIDDPAILAEIQAALAQDE
jgi:propionyl-CoA synthetase